MASIVLLVATGLLVRALWSIQATRSGLPHRRRADAADDAADAALRGDRDESRVLRARARAGPRAAGRLERGVHQLPADGDAAAGSGASGYPGVPATPSAATKPRPACDSSRQDSFTTMAIPLRRGRDVSESDTVQSQLWPSSASRSSSATPGQAIRSAGRSRSARRERTDRRRRRHHPRARPRADERAAGLPAVRAAAGRLVRVLRAQGSRRPCIDAARSTRYRRSRSIIHCGRSAAADLRRPPDERHPRRRDGVANAAGSSARRFRARRVHAGRDRRPRRAGVRRVPADGGDRRAGSRSGHSGATSSAWS